MFLIGGCGYFFTQLSLELSGMLVLSSLIGVGLMLMSPYPIVEFLQWAQQQDMNKIAVNISDDIDDSKTGSTRAGNTKMDNH